MSNIIKEVFGHNRQLNEISFVEDEMKVSNKYSIFGFYAPIIKINNRFIDNSKIMYFEINMYGFLPKILLKFYINRFDWGDSDILSVNVPKDKDLIEVFIRSNDELFKPIRCDFVINYIDFFSSNRDEIYVHASGILNVPELYYINNFVIEGSSLKVLMECAKKMNLGFATNEYNDINAAEWGDKQKWICANSTMLDFIDNVCAHAWKNENSFFNCFIDLYYNLNFVNINSLLTFDKKIEDALLDLNTIPQIENFLNDTPIGTKKIFIYSSSNVVPKHNFAIFKYNLLNSSFEASLSKGYKNVLSYYDKNNLEYVKVTINPIITKDAAKNKIILRDRPGSYEYKNIYSVKGLGAIFLDNVNKHYLMSKYHNKLNINELEKINLEIYINRGNFNIYKYEVVPCLIFEDDEFTRANMIETELNEKNATPNNNEHNYRNSKINRFLSGFFIIWNISYVLDYTRESEGLVQKILLTRREWESPSI